MPTPLMPPTLSRIGGCRGGHECGIALFGACGLIIAASIPLILRRVGPNPVYGFRTPLTFSSSAIWYPANAFAGWALLIAALVSALALLVIPEDLVSPTWAPQVLFVAPLAFALGACLRCLCRLR